MTWPTVPLSDVAEVRLGRQRSPKNHTGDTMRPYLRAANVTWGGISLDDVKSMNFTDSEMETYRLVAGDLLLSEASGSPGEVGKPALWNGQLDECAFQNTLIRVRPQTHDPRFLLHFFRLQVLAGRFVEHSRGVGIHHLGRARLASWPTPVPPLDEQRRIVEVLEDHLSRLDAADSYLRRVVAAARALERSALMRCREGSPVPLPDVAVIQGGIQKQQKRRPRNNSFPFLRVANVTADGLDLSDVHQIELFDGELDRLKLMKGDLLVVEGNGSPRQIGRAAVWDGSIDNCVHQNHLIRVRPKPEVLHPVYSCDVSPSPLHCAPPRRTSRLSSGLHTLSVSKLNGLSIPLPDVHRQRHLVSAVRATRGATTRIVDQTEAGRRRGGALRRALLAAAFSGRLTGTSSDDERIEEMIEA